ncbi:MAG: cytochrome c oxidase assembly protein [Paracoccaceae bacterium]|jgi:cytochrome c oxidase assembly protein subunit 11|nr:cytochrome c oxidase assembly protein [Paracoccaceae bacterium]MDP7185875.1 cytochrome c oxidase assembly protein [Paracoccaceae bacterium]
MSALAVGKNRTLLQLLGVILLMGSLAWASVPLYDLFCRITGYGGTTAQSDQESDVVLDQIMTINFDASKTRGMPWEFKPVERSMDIRIGETGLAYYEAYNPTDRVVAGSANYNVFPYDTGSFFVKLDCFCFEEQVLQPGERVLMPVSFYVDPEIVNDRDAKFAKRITLSYTFHEIDVPEDYAASGASETTKLN